MKNPRSYGLEHKNKGAVWKVEEMIDRLDRLFPEKIIWESIIAIELFLLTQLRGT